jgi:TP901 family phage tail tape measure protein
MALQPAGVELVADGLSGFMSDMGKANKAVSNFGDTGKSAGSMFEKGFGQVAIGALREVGALAVDALGKAAVAVGGFVADSIGLAGDFQSGMQEFQAVAGQDVDAKGLEQFHDLFLQLGKDLPVSTSDVQKAAIEMVKGGIDPATVAAGGLRQNIQFAAAAMDGDLAAAAEVSAKILGGWADANATAADKSKFLTDATDLLTKAANASSVDVHELSLGIFNSQGIAKAAGVSFEDLTTTLAELAPRFASSSEAGTSLKNLIARLNPTTKSQIGAFKALNLITAEGKNVFYDAQGSFVGFQQASQLLQESLKGLTNEQRTAMLQTIFGNDAMSAASALAELGSAGYQKMADSLDKANGVAANAALKQQGYNTALENAKGSVEALQITLGEKLLPILTDLLNNYIAPGINAITQFADALFSAEDPVVFLSDTVSQFSPVLGTLVGAIGDFVVSGGDLGVVLDDLSEGFGINLQWVKSLSDFLIGSVVPAFMDTGDTVTVMSDTTSNSFNDIFQVGQDVFGILGKYIPDIMESIEKISGAVLEQIAIFWKNNGADIMDFVTKAWTTISKIISGVAEIILILVGGFLKQVSDWFAKYHTEIQFVVKGAWDVISGIISGVMAIILGVVNTTLALLKGDFSGAWDAIKQMSVDFVKALDSIFAGLLEIAIGVGMDIVKGIKQGINDAWDKLVRWFNEKLQELKDKLPFSEPKDPLSPLRGLSKSGAAIVDMLQMGIDGAGGLSIGAPTIGGMRAPPASAAQILGSGGNTTTNNYSRSINMPVYTNNSPAAVTQSGAILNAILP